MLPAIQSLTSPGRSASIFGKSDYLSSVISMRARVKVGACVKFVYSSVSSFASKNFMFV